MNPGTGALAMFETDQDAIDAGFGVKLSADEAMELSGQARSQRLQWLAERQAACERDHKRRLNILAAAAGAAMASSIATGEPPARRVGKSTRFKTRKRQSR